MVSLIFFYALFKIGVLAMGQCHEQAKERSFLKRKILPSRQTDRGPKCS